MARNTSKNREMQQHPEMVKAAAKSKPVRRAIAGGGWSTRDIVRPFEMVNSPAGGGEIVGRALQFDEQGNNILPADAVLVCVFKQYAVEPMKGPCRHLVFSRSELTPFDSSAYATREDKNDVQHSDSEKEVLEQGEGKDGTQSA